MDKDELLALAERVEALEGSSNEVDVLVECALNGCRPNYARTKVIYTVNGRQETFLAADWTFRDIDRARAAAALRALAAQQPSGAMTGE